VDARQRALALLGGVVGAVAPVHPSNPLWNVTAITGIPRIREWDAVATARAPQLTGDAVHFVATPDGTVIVDEDVPDGSAIPLAEAIEATIRPPYRARGVRHEDGLWAVGALRIDVVALPPDYAGDELELVVKDGRTTLHVDGRPSFAIPPGLPSRDGDHVVRARRLDETLWEAEVGSL
jgi:hypothetical protein